MKGNEGKGKQKSPLWGIFPKLLILFLLLSIIPLMALGYMANKNMAQTGQDSTAIAMRMGEENLKAARETGRLAIEDSVHALDEKSTQAIELRTVELAVRIADFLYERDNDIKVLAAFRPDPEKYRLVYLSSVRDVIVPRNPPPGAPSDDSPGLLWSNPANRMSWRHRPPDDFSRISKPIYKEITFIDLWGNEKIKVKNGRISKDLRDVSRRENTFCKAEDYFSHLSSLKKGEIYVSRVIGAYKKGWLYKDPEGIKVKPESAHAGKENPSGERFEGIIRWATPVYENGKKTGYLTMALDHIHVMEFTDHVVPTEERFSALSDGGSGNYAFLWDDRDRCISHARDFFVCGYDPETGEEVPGWVSQKTYDEYKKSGLSLREFVARLPSFRDFNQKKSGSKDQLRSGEIALDCRILDTAPQCEGWHRGTEDGGTGSFLILWSGLWKLTTYATVPYYTGAYGASKRGFGYVTIGANVDDFHEAANKTRDSIEESIARQEEDMRSANEMAGALIEGSARRNRNLITVITVIAVLSVVGASILLGFHITRPLKRLTQGAVAISKGELNQHIRVKSRDEIGQLADSFNEMADAVAQVDRMKSEFVTIASHEFRTPIHAMLLGVSGILEGYSGDIDHETREDLQVVNEGIVRLTGLVENLLDLSRIESRKFELNLARISVKHILKSALGEVSQLMDSHGHTVIERYSSKLPDIYGDEKRMIQVVVNLLSNSIKYTPEGGKILIGAEKEGNDMVFSVADNGYGIPLEVHDKVFERFFQADSIMSQKVGGSGLGLTIAEGIVQEHGGSIHFESPLQTERFPDLPLGGDRKGTVFRVHLPVGGPQDIHAG
jgi:signal transduction histidine kinase